VTGSEGDRAAKKSARLLDAIERLGNRLPDPALLFVIALVITWVTSALLSGHRFEVPSVSGPKPNSIVSQLTPSELVAFLKNMVTSFTGFAPLGVVLVALLGVGVAERAGFIDALIRRLLAITPARLLTPMMVLVAVISHSAADAGIVLVIPIGGIIYRAAGRHPLAGIAAAFAGVSGGFSASFLPTGLDPLLQGLTQEAAHIIDPARDVNPLCNWFFTSASSLLVIGLGWYITDRVIEPRLARVALDGEADVSLKLEPLAAPERRGLRAGLFALASCLALLGAASWSPSSPLRGPNGSLTESGAPLMQAIIPLMFFLFLVPGLAHGYVSGRFTSHRDVIAGMTQVMGTMSYYLVMAFGAALFIYSFNRSQLGALLAVQGAEALRSAGLPAPATVVGVIVLSATVDLVVGSASAKWAFLAPIFVPMLMQLGISPELAQASYRIGDSTSNIITPLMPYFPLVVTFCQRYVKSAGVGTLVSLMLPYSLVFFVAWTSLLMLFWALGVPLGLSGGYAYP
jgi:aminobenzoyl-glutamate transport protein